MRVERHKIPAGETIAIETSGEVFIHPLVGRGSVDGIAIGGRRRIFDAFPGGIYVTKPEFRIVADTDFDVIVAAEDNIRTLSDALRVEAKIHMIGEGTARREVREILGHGGPSIRLRCGETVNRPGGWSSWPPHKFDHDSTTTGFEEVFYVFTDPRDSYCLMPTKGTIGGHPVDEVVKLHSGERCAVPLGSHPIVAAPGTRLLYCWFMVGADKRYAQWADDLGGYK